MWNLLVVVVQVRGGDGVIKWYQDGDGDVRGRRMMSVGVVGPGGCRVMVGKGCRVIYVVVMGV